ncbi:bublin coiled-coil protein isoform X1 [Anser cygnoides]|uniref:bublin coiled-coil protein isoform X1 n=1 Tax=Anser cygnoides TaxID=8845 RepID=UPI0020097368|nr:bublin coiled-coil protein isoform X2 [Anser cygnoides]
MDWKALRERRHRRARQQLHVEYAAINSMLDQINSCLDHLEEKNDYLHACLKELLESNRQTRLEFQQQSEQQNMEADGQGSQPPV